MLIKTLASSEPTLQNLRVVEVKIAKVENTNYKIINALVVRLIVSPLSQQCVCIAKNKNDHLKYLRFSDSSDSKFICNVDIFIGAYYYWDIVSGNNCGRQERYQFVGLLTQYLLLNKNLVKL